ncbi:MAG: PAS domain S-box protein [Methanomicrobiales archaeon]|nr:PAS domain S-box protein [Methanomicrobiales archaeon]
MPPRELKEISDNIQLNQNDTISLLYVDDEQDLLIVGKIFLERTGGFTVETMTSAKEALNSPFIQSYDAIVSDYQMPGMNGIEFLKVIREKHGDIPFILFTGRGREEIVIEAINNGADFYLQKGGEPKSQFAELSHKIKQAVRSRRAEKERQEQFNELVRIKEALEESESKFRAIVETTPDAIWEIDLSGTFVYISPRCKEIIGYTQDEMTGSSSFEYLNDEGSLILKTLLNNVHTRKPGIGTFDIPAIHKDKSIRILNFRTYPLVNADNNLIGFRGICSDVTERTAFVNALHESEIRLRSFFEATSEGIFIIDEDGIIIEWNAMSEKIFGIEKEKALGAYLWDLQFLVMRPEIQQTTSVDAVRQNILSSLKTGMPVYQEPVTIEAVRPDGRGIITRQTIFPIQTDKGYRFGSVLEDITEEMHMAEALRESEERFRGMAERSPDLIIIVDKEMDISYVSPSATAIIGYEPGELIGNPIESAFAPIFSNNSQDIAEIIWKIKGGESIESKEIQIQKKDGSKVFVNFYAIPTSFEGILSGIQISMRDITQNKIYEVERRNSEEKFVTLFNKNPVTLTLVSIVDGCFIDLNEAFERNTGFHRDEVVGRSSKELGLFADEAEYQQFSQELKEKHFVLGMELQCRAKSGEIRLCRFSSSIIIIQGVPQILSSIEDITEYKQNEAMLREREERYRLIMQNAYEGILLTN